jgi:hypothetical protein
MQNEQWGVLLWFQPKRQSTFATPKHYLLLKGRGFFLLMRYGFWHCYFLGMFCHFSLREMLVRAMGVLFWLNWRNRFLYSISVLPLKQALHMHLKGKRRYFWISETTFGFVVECESFTWKKNFNIFSLEGNMNKQWCMLCDWEIITFLHNKLRLLSSSKEGSCFVQVEVRFWEEEISGAFKLKNYSFFHEGEMRNKRWVGVMLWFAKG